MFALSLLLVTCLVGISQANAVPQTSAAHSSPRQVTRAEILARRAQRSLLPRQAEPSSSVYPTCGDSPATSGPVYATLSGQAGRFDSADYFIYPQKPGQIAGDCAALCEAESACVASGLHDSLCFLWNKAPVSLDPDSGYSVIVEGGCTTLPDALKIDSCCNTYVGQ